MKRVSVMIGLVGLIGVCCVVLTPRSVPAQVEEAAWTFAGGPEVCDALFDDSVLRICVVWWELMDEKDGTVCCVEEDKVPRNDFEDCDRVIGKRVRPSNVTL